ncbi:peptidylprolyl isomerase [Bradyrhizobium sp. HKCCYLS3077]|uniref:peptidylprolyl isomerase n=1 Tax=Bradyrhizobium sp. HKCCYLS3077 TaxID=3420761 RepID=UPI003EB6A9C7
MMVDVPKRMMFRSVTSRTPVLAACLVAGLSMVSAARADEAATDPVIATVNGAAIRESELAMVDEIVGRNLPTQDRIERRDAILKMMVDTILLAEVARERKVIDEADIARRTNFARNQGLMTHLLRQVGESAVNEETVRKAYRDVVMKAASEQTEVHLRHLVFLTKDASDDAALKAIEARAQGALDRLRNGEDFTVVAAEVSDDPVTKSRGGDFGWRIRPELSKEYADAAFAMKNGDISPLIRTGIGLHIIKLEDRRTRKPPEFDTVRERVAAMVSATAQIELAEKTRAAAKIERFDGGAPMSPGAQPSKK